MVYFAPPILREYNAKTNESPSNFPAAHRFLSGPTSKRDPGERKKKKTAFNAVTALKENPSVNGFIALQTRGLV